MAAMHRARCSRTSRTAPEARVTASWQRRRRRKHDRASTRRHPLVGTELLDRRDPRSGLSVHLGSRVESRDARCALQELSCPCAGAARDHQNVPRCLEPIERRDQLVAVPCERVTRRLLGLVVLGRAVSVVVDLLGRQRLDGVHWRRFPSAGVRRQGAELPPDALTRSPLLVHVDGFRANAASTVHQPRGAWPVHQSGSDSGAPAAGISWRCSRKGTT
jgi:hypothetical protein